MYYIVTTLKVENVKKIRKRMTFQILSIQSHVVSGHVGNKSAVFPLQILGHQVDSINTVQFSNHSSYPIFPGERLPPQTFLDIIQGLEKNQILQDYTHLLCGYVGKSETLAIIYDLVIRMKKLNPHLVFVLDTVMGDNGRVYVPLESVEIYKQLCGLADIITPNAFEVE